MLLDIVGHVIIITTSLHALVSGPNILCDWLGEMQLDEVTWEVLIIIIAYFGSIDRQLVDAYIFTYMDVWKFDSIKVKKH